MNYDDINEEGIPPYDLPIFGDSENNSDKKQDIQPSEQENNQIAEVAESPEQQSDEHNIEEISLDSVQEQMQEEYNDTISAEEVPGDENLSPDSVNTKKKSGGSKLILPLVIVFLGLFLAGSLVLIYADNLNIPYLSEMMAKISGKSSDKVITVDEKRMDMPVPNQENEVLDEELQKLMGEDTEDIGVEYTRNGSGMPPVEGPGQNGPIGMPAGSPNNMQAPVGTPGMPQGIGNVPSGNEIDYPPLQNSYGQQPGVNVIQPYSRNIGRLDPFNPSGGTNQMYDVIIPPTNPIPDEKAQQLMALKISGIMYSADSPSAIINIAGSDQLVRKGDKFNGFSVEKITKDKVTVKAGTNVYTASVGEILNIEQVGVNSIPNLNKKFGGPYSKGKDRIIEINMLE